MTELARLAAELGDFCQRREWRFCVIGGLAVQHWGEPRMTMDVDLSLLTGFGHEEAFIDEWLRHYAGRLPNARDFALKNRVLLLRHASGAGIDIALGAVPFEERLVDRARVVEMGPGCPVRLCAAEDLIVMKAFADRPIDWLDIRGILVRQGVDRLGWPQIRRELKPLGVAKEQPEILEKLEGLRKEVEGL